MASRESYLRNREAILARMREEYAADPERFREKNRRSYAANAEARREYSRRYRERHPDRVKGSSRRYNAANKDKIREQKKRYNAANPVDYRLKNLRNVHGMYPEEWMALWDAQDGRCYLCRRPLGANLKDIHVDHDHSCCGSRRSCRACRRGLACKDCNTLIGLAGDDPDRLRLIAGSLEAAKSAVVQRKAAMDMQLSLAEEIA